MYPWFALGHLTPYLQLSNRLAEKGHRISFIIPIKTQPKLEHLNRHPDLITFKPIIVPHVDGLPPGAETTFDVPFPLSLLLMTAMDRTKAQIELLLHDLKPNIVFFDFSHWMLGLTRRLGIKLIHYCVITPIAISYIRSPARLLDGNNFTEADMMQPPSGYPDSSIKLHVHEARASAALSVTKVGGDHIRFCDRLHISFSQCDAIAFKACREIEGPYCDYLESQFRKPVLLMGPLIPEPPTSTFDEKWVKFLGGFKAGSVIYCAFGSECYLKKDQFQELLLGLELTGMPFLAALKPPVGAESTGAALPEGFEERVQGKGVVYGGWVQQHLILKHPSVECFITHCGTGSLSEGLVNERRLVFLPHVGDQNINARMMSKNLKVGVEVEKGKEDGLFTKEGVCKAVMTVMDEDSEVGREVRANHAKWREFLLTKDLESSYIDTFNQKLQDLVIV